MLTATRKLLTSLETLPYRGRMSALAAWARTAPDRAAVCAELRGRGVYERRLALVAAMVVRDRDGIAAAANDPVPALRAEALAAAVFAGLPAGEHADRPEVERRRIYRALRQRHAPEIADALMPEIRARFGDDEAIALLPGCGTETVRALLPELEHGFGLSRLVRRHAGVVLDRARERLAAAEPEDRDRVWTDVIHAVLRCDPAQALDLLERYGPEDSLPGSLTAYGPLARHDVHRVARLLAAPARTGWLERLTLPPGLLRRLITLPTDELASIGVRFRHNGAGLTAFLDALPPSRRGELYDLIMADADTSMFLPATAVMEVLPAAIRIREARRVLSLPRISENETHVQTWSAYLAWPDARAALETALRSGDAEERSAGYALLIGAARHSRDPHAVAEMITRLERLRNERDPVRASALTALAAVAPLLTAESTAGLTRLTTDAAEARDASYATTSALGRLAADVLRHHVGSPELSEWALFTIDLVSSGSAVPVLRRFDSVLRRGQESLVFARLRRWIEDGIARADYGRLFALTHALGRRARHVPELQELLRAATGKRTLPAVARTAVDLWLADPRHRSARVAEVLDADVSTATLHVVWTTICTVRTDLLDRVLARPVKGRFVEKGTRWVPGWSLRPERWLPRQQDRFVELQALIAADEGQGVWRRAQAIKAAAGISGAGRELVLRYLDDPEVAIAEAALGALAWTDRPDLALPVLLRYADGDRARVALYAAGRAARHVPPSVLEGVLGPVLAGPAKVTSRKEAARLLAGFGTPAVMATLLAAYTRPDQHRDIRAAIVSAARQRLGVEESWDVLRTAVGGSREERRAVLHAQPYLIAERHRPRYARFIVDAAGAGDREVRRAAFGRFGTWAPWLTGTDDMIVDRLTDLRESLTHMDIAGLLRAGGPTVLARTLTALVDLDAQPGGGAPVQPGAGADASLESDAHALPESDAHALPESDATVSPESGAPGERADGVIADRPARRRVELLARGANVRARTLPPSADRSVLIAPARWLAGRPGFTAIGAAMLVDLGRLDNLDEIVELCAARPVLAAHLADRAATRMRSLRDWYDPDAIARLTARGDVAGGLFAVALVPHGAGFGWKEPWRGLLAALRAHPDADVRESALGIDMS
ncbi:hypothetical protein J2S43_003634 [Catenuloplanes nepalensis]|uniref:Uncharacterized protein n=1 Tax=Catenuloplanes nepalensis TaxID=587533 RepID=A0ABT9MUK2_9ACTN|nr:hypothetical protein [Catenuloplanes nepalensis]